MCFMLLQRNIHKNVLYAVTEKYPQECVCTYNCKLVECLCKYNYVFALNTE